MVGISCFDPGSSLLESILGYFERDPRAVALFQAHAILLSNKGKYPSMSYRCFIKFVELVLFLCGCSQSEDFRRFCLLLF